MKLSTILLWIVAITLIIAIARQLSQTQIYLLPDFWGKQFSTHGWDLGKQPLPVHQKFMLENFANATSEQIANVKGIVEKTEYNPANASLEKPLDNYALLSDVLPSKKVDGTLTAQTCYNTDYYRHTDRTGNYIQRTNNFRHNRPDSCSAERTELVNSFYVNA